MSHKGVLEMVCGSTNVVSFGKSGAELDVRKNILDIMQRLNKGIIVT